MTLISALVTIVAGYGGAELYANVLTDATGAVTDIVCDPWISIEKTDEITGQKEREQWYKDQAGRLYYHECIKADYHSYMNEFFDYNIAEMIAVIDESLEKGEDFSKKPEFLVPVFRSQKELQEQCANEADTAYCVKSEKRKDIALKCADNLSAYCVSMQAMYVYIDYLNILIEKKALLPDLYQAAEDDQTGVARYTVAYNTWFAMLQRSQQVNKEIDQEIEDARRVMEYAVSAYNEFTMAYPLHRKYEEIIENLVKYKLHLKEIRNSVIAFPGRFIDVTSTTCP